MMVKKQTLDYFQLQKNIHNKQLKPIYLIYGEESHLHTMSFKAFKDCFGKSEVRINTEIFYGENLNFNTLSNSFNVLPLGVDKQCIMIKQIEKLKVSVVKRLEFFINNLSFGDGNIIVILFSNDKKLPANLPLDKIREFGHIVFLQRPKTFQIRQWIGQKCRENNKTISPEAIYFMQGLADNDLNQINNELEKLFCYLGESSLKIDKEDIIGCFDGGKSGNIFDFVDAIGEKNTELALALLGELVQSEYHPLSLLAMINRQIKLILQTKQSSGNQEQIKADLHLPLFVINKLIRQAKKYSLVDLKKAYQSLLGTEIKLKTGHYSPVFVLEQLVLKITQ